MKEYTDKIESLVQQFDYDELNDVDKSFVVEVLGSKEAYTLLRTSILQAKASAGSFRVDGKMKNTLVSEFKNTRRRKASSPLLAVFNRKIPAYYSLILLLLMALPFFYLLTNRPQNVEPQITYVNLPGTTDTLYVSTPADTVFVDKVVYQKVYIPAEPKKDVLLTSKPVSKVTESFAESDVNTSLSGNAALNDLMISIE
ncbi:MAG: hypothetical protein AAFQ94_20540 [Bacteroidota bacterium]